MKYRNTCIQFLYFLSFFQLYSDWRNPQNTCLTVKSDNILALGHLPCSYLHFSFPRSLFFHIFRLLHFTIFFTETQIQHIVSINNKFFKIKIHMCAPFQISTKVPSFVYIHAYRCSMERNAGNSTFSKFHTTKRKFSVFFPRMWCSIQTVKSCPSPPWNVSPHERWHLLYGQNLYAPMLYHFRNKPTSE